MGSRQVGNWLVAVLIMLNCLAIWGIFHIWWENAAAVSPSQARKSLDIPMVPRLRDQQTLQDFRVVAAKNLFSQDRTGPNEGPVAPQGQGSLDGKLLLGTMIIGDQRVALIGGSSLRRSKDMSAEAVRLGEQWEGYKLVEINRDSVVFLGKNGKTTLQFPE